MHNYFIIEQKNSFYAKIKKDKNMRVTSDQLCSEKRFGKRQVYLFLKITVII